MNIWKKLIYLSGIQYFSISQTAVIYSDDLRAVFKALEEGLESQLSLSSVYRNNLLIENVFIRSQKPRNAKKKCR